ncbi:MAG: CHAD domain-containing protein [Gammaproteobacteria bacterium]|jgi:CHAD domain-containing protein
MREIAHYLLRGTAGFVDTAAALRAIPRVELQAHLDGARHYLDTPDRGLLHHNLVLECDRDPETTRLGLRQPQRLLVSGAWSDEVPRSAVDILDADARQLVFAAIRSERLIVVENRPLRVAGLQIVDARGRPVARIIVQQFTDGLHNPTPIALRIYALPGRLSHARKAVERIRQQLSLDDIPGPVELRDIDLASADLPTALLCKVPATTDRDEIGVAINRILAANFHVLATRERGIEADLDTEFLHDYRIALRRMRSLFDAFKPLFDERTAGLFKADLKWLNEVTGGRRDLDVFLHQFPALQRATPRRYGPALEQLRDFIVTERENAQSRLTLELTGERYDVFKADWRALLERPQLAGKGHDEPVTEAAGASIWKTYRRIRKQIREPHTTGAIAALHALRKDCKKLRYQIESFKTLFPRRRLKRAVAELKQLQDMLGAVCDLSVQQEFLIERREQMLDRLSDTSPLAQLLEKLLNQYGEAEKTLRRNIRSDLDRFGSKPVMRRYRSLFAPDA